MQPPSPQVIYPPPLEDLGTPLWTKWFREVLWPIIGAGSGQSGPQVTTPKLQIGNAQFSSTQTYLFQVTTPDGQIINLAMDVNAVIYTAQAGIALGGGAAATLGTIGGSGPTTAAQNKWLKQVHKGVTYFIPLWI